MQRICQTMALCFVGLSAYVVWESWNLEYYTNLGPGGGFFPFWLGVVMGGLSLVWLVQVSGSKGSLPDTVFLPERLGLGRILSTIAALVAMAGFMNLLGFQLTMFLFLIFLLLVLGRQGILVTLIVALLGSAGVYHMFGRFLDVPLPAATIKFLANLGL